MKNFILTITLSFAFATSVTAEDKNMYVYLKSGDVVMVSISELPKITFDDGVMTVGTELFQVSNVSKYTIGSGTDDVISINACDLKIDARRGTEGYVSISNLGKQDVNLYDLSGKEVKFKLKKENENDVMVDFNDQTAGTYIIKVGSESLKILKK